MMTRALRAVLCAMVLCITRLPSRAAEKYPLGFEMDGPKSRYTSLLLRVASNWPSKRILATKESPAYPMDFHCIETPGEDYYMGFEQFQWISAPFEKVVETLDDIDSYKEIFPGFAETKILKKDENLWTVFWEQTVPVFFIPNVRYESDYVIHSPSADRRIYRYQLKRSDVLTKSDGMIIVDRRGTDKTRYAEYDFYDAHWGLAKAAGKGKIWRDNAEGIVLSDFGIKLKAENSGKSGKWVRDEAKRLLENGHVDIRCSRKIPAAALEPDRN